MRRHNKIRDIPEADAEPELPEQATGKEFKVIKVRENGSVVLDADDSKGGMFRAVVTDEDLKFEAGDTVRVSFESTDENGYPVDARITSVK